MSDKSSIEWTDATWNPVTGCTQIPGKVAGSGCDFCYAKKLLDTRQRANPKSARFGLPFETVLMHEDRLHQPYTWSKPRRIFVNSLSDLFHADVPAEFIFRVLTVMKNPSAQRHTFQVLTKRPERMRRIVQSFVDECGVIPNLHLGVSVENEQAAWRIEHLRKTPATVRWISAEPLIGSLKNVALDGLDWVVLGGESGGPHVRPMRAEWARDVRDRCATLGIPFLFKQWGSHDSDGFSTAKHLAGRELDGRTHDEYPRA